LYRSTVLAMLCQSSRHSPDSLRYVLIIADSSSGIDLDGYTAWPEAERARAAKNVEQSSAIRNQTSKITIIQKVYIHIFLFSFVPLLSPSLLLVYPALSIILSYVTVECLSHSSLPPTTNTTWMTSLASPRLVTSHKSPGQPPNATLPT
jgi:hypothetical protein